MEDVMSRFWKRSSWLLACAMVMGGVLTTGSAQAQAAPATDAITPIDPLDIPPENDPLAHAFDRPRERGGFYLRLSSSIGVHNTRLGPAPFEDDSASHAHGFGSGFGLDAGYVLAPWVAVHANSTLGVLWNGNVHDEVSVSGSPRNKARVLAYGLAPAATFFTPHDFRFTTAFGVGMATIKTRSASDDTTKPGFYMDLVAGKDIVVSPNFAIGVQFQVVYMLLGNDDAHEEARVRQFLFGLSGAFDSI